MAGIPEGTVLAWSNRFGWLEHVTKPTKSAKPASMQGAIAAIKPADALQKALQEDGDACRTLALAYSRKALGEAIERESGACLEVAQDVKAVVQTAALAAGWQQAGPSTVLQVNVLNMGAEQWIVEEP